MMNSAFMEKGDGKRKKHNFKQTNKKKNISKFFSIGSGPYHRILVL